MLLIKWKKECKLSFEENKDFMQEKLNIDRCKLVLKKDLVEMKKSLAPFEQSMPNGTHKTTKRPASWCLPLNLVF